MIRGLFVNTEKANCSIYKSGQMVYDIIKESRDYSLDYIEVSPTQRDIENGYDFYVFNYHHATMGWLDTKQVKNFTGVKMTLVTEVAPGDIFVHCPQEDFDVYLPLDPTAKHWPKIIYPMPRPIQSFNQPFDQGFHSFDLICPIIGTFGFATPGKGFELVVEAVNREFDRAIIRINIPPATHADGLTFGIHNRPYAEYLSELCKKVAKPGIDVQVTHAYMTDEELVQWCAENTLNVFLYDRKQPGLSATTDQAISSGRPLAVSTNGTFRHIHEYINPYPYRSLMDSIKQSAHEVKRIQEKWSHNSFRDCFNDILLDHDLIEKVGRYDPIEIVIINHPQAKCGIHQYGINLDRVLGRSERYFIRYAECSNEDELREAAGFADGMIYNYYPLTMPWLTREMVWSHPGISMGIFHEVNQEAADTSSNQMFDYLLCPDPTLIENVTHVRKIGRIIPHYTNTKPVPTKPLIGSFGFGFKDKGFDRLVGKVQAEFDEATILLHVPNNDLVDPEGDRFADEVLDRCEEVIIKPGIKLLINRSFLPLPQLLDLLAACSINIFCYDEGKDQGISSVIEHALAVRRPIAITRSGMFRHVLGAKPSICLEDRTIKEIMDEGIAPLVPFYASWSEEAFLCDTEKVLERIFADKKSAPFRG